MVWELDFREGKIIPKFFDLKRIDKSKKLKIYFN
jgi:hypothetical protein